MAEAVFDRGDGLWEVVEVIESSEMFIEVGGAGGAAAEGVDLGMGEAPEIVELHRGKWGAEVDEFGRGTVELPAFVVGADDKHAHVEFPGGLHGGPVQFIDEIVVEVDIVETTAMHGGEDDVVPPQDAEDIVARAGDAAELVSLPDADHVFNVDADAMVQTVVAWVQQQTRS